MTAAAHPDGPAVVVDQLQLELDGVEPLSQEERLEAWFRDQEADSADSRVAALFLRDRRTRRDRAARWAQIQAVQAPFDNGLGWLIPGGHETLWLYHEAQRSYVEGLPLASLLCAHAACERVLAGCMLSYEDELDKNWRFWGLGALIKAAFERHLIDQSLRDALGRVNDIRKVSAHFKPPLEPQSLAVRAIEGSGIESDLDHDEAMDRLAESDALLAITTVTELMRGDQGYARVRFA